MKTRRTTYGLTAFLWLAIFVKFFLFSYDWRRISYDFIWLLLILKQEDSSCFQFDFSPHFHCTLVIKKQFDLDVVPHMYVHQQKNLFGLFSTLLIFRPIQFKYIWQLIDKNVKNSRFINYYRRNGPFKFLLKLTLDMGCCTVCTYKEWLYTRLREETHQSKHTWSPQQWRISVSVNLLKLAVIGIYRG